jgi:transcription antitermination factor NusG
MLDTAVSWYALRVRPRHEKSVSHLLKAKGYPELLPLYKERHQWADRAKDVVLPLFPGYLFCHFNPSDRIIVEDTPGVMGVVRTRSSLLPVDESEIRALQQALSSNLELEPSPQIAAGTIVRVIEGPLFGVTGPLVQHKNSTKLVISISLLQRSVLVELRPDWVVPADQKVRAWREV